MLVFEVAKRISPAGSPSASSKRRAGGAGRLRSPRDFVGDDFQPLAIEIDKLATWADGEPVGESEVEPLVAAVAETPPFALTDAWAQRDGGGARGEGDDLRARRSPRRDTAPRWPDLGGHLACMRR